MVYQGGLVKLPKITSKKIPIKAGSFYSYEACGVGFRRGGEEFWVFYPQIWLGLLVQ